VDSTGPRPKRQRRTVAGRRPDALNPLMILKALEQTRAIVGIVEGQIIHWSPGAERLYGWTAIEAIGSPARDLLKQKGVGALEAGAAALPCGESWAGQVRRSHKDGRELAIAAHCVSGRDRSGRATVIELDTLIEPALPTAAISPGRVRHAEAKAAPTGRIVHDFNNLLGIITLNLELARERVGAGSELRRLIDEALDAAWQSSEMTSRLADLARRRPV
jgi:PAS domain S-box-containing protein